MNLSELKQKKVAIWGYGVEGKATAQYLKLRCSNLDFTVLCPIDEIDGQPYNFYTQEVNTACLDQFDVVIKSPGISPYIEPAKSAQCAIISSTSLWFHNEQSGKVIAITGTKGKSTSCAMLANVLSDLGFAVVLAGNFGVPLISCTEKYDFVVLETSSYQSQDGAIKADIAVILNLYVEHLNWHLSEQQYHQDKLCLLKHAKLKVLNAKDQQLIQYVDKLNANDQVNWFNQENGFYELNHVLMYQDKALMSAYGWQLKGAHNLINAAAVCAVIELLHLDIKAAMNSLKQFKPLPHRLQSLGQIHGVDFINDSIASTPHATLAALKTVDVKKTIVLVGGFDRGVDWDWWVEAIKSQPPKMIVCSGQNGEKIHQTILNHEIKTQSIWQPNLKDAVKTAVNAASMGDVVLLSPGAPSFDAFKDYQHRGQQFEQWIK
ncbi:UDP-N-acetylmuramoyl-L-alanine--D-glutamate ligase [Marinicella litoralis]|uniref:UDP-N-acetylmuramoylalanine--D-glutamate ligase n=1 Tax=Marinicella litoralis TaxID=644220 RepID=A0A4R6XVU3_9GAMM|nr:UDP-N-acetylmuramoyl-L-alanine--D-glutamate ligase [Marinicella litoralis]TDR22679.1 UDP-N-acetylmuramoylalanine--D-glutamate ligase [Marinicella litoralis]